MTEQEFKKTIAETTNSTPTITYSVGKRMFTGKFKNSMDHNQVMFADSIDELFKKMTGHLKKYRIKPENKWDNKVFKNNEKAFKLP